MPGVQYLRVIILSEYIRDQTVVARDGLKLFVIVCQEFVGVVTYSEESVRHQVNEGC